MISNQYQRSSSLFQPKQIVPESQPKHYLEDNSPSKHYPKLKLTKQDSVEISTGCQKDQTIQECSLDQSYLLQNGYSVQIYQICYHIDTDSIVGFRQSFENIQYANKLQKTTILALQIVILQRIGKLKQEFINLKEKLLIQYSSQKLIKVQGL